MKNDSAKHRFGLFLSIIPIPIFLFLAILFFLTGHENSIIFDPPALLPALNLFFLFLCPMVVGFLAAKGYLETGYIRLLMLGSGVFSLALGSLIAGVMLPAQGPNAVITVHNISAFLSGVFHLAGTTMSLFGFQPQEDAVKRKTVLIIVFSGIIAFLVMITFGVLQGILPVFFVQGQGATLLRQFILGFAVLSFFISGLFLVMLYRDSRIRFLSLYAEALFLISIGLSFVFIQKIFGSPIGWLGRIAQYTGGVYLLIAVLSGAKEFSTKVLLLDKFLEKFFRNRFEVLLSERTKALALANEQLQVEIHERKLAENNAQESETQFRLLVETTKAIAWEIDLESLKFKYISPRIYDLTGYRHEMWKDMEFWAGTLHPDDRDDSVNFCKIETAKGKDHEFEYRMITPDERTIWIRDLVTVVKENGIPVLLRGYMIDINEQKKSEEALRNSETRLRLALEAAIAGTWEWDVNTNKNIWSNELYRLYDLNPQTVEASYESWLQSVFPEDRKAIETAVHSATSSESELNIEWRVNTADGLPRWLMSRGQPIRNSDGKVLKYHGIAIDITTRKQTEEKLYETQAFLHAAMDHSQAGIAIAEAPNGTLRYVNNAGLFIRGGDRKSVINGVGIEQYVASWQLLDFDGRPLRTDEVPLARAIMFGETCSREFIIRRSESDERIVLANAAPITNSLDQIIAGIVVFLDITERKQSEFLLKESEEKFRNFTEQSLVGFYIIQDGVFKYANPKFAEIFGYTIDECADMSFHQLVFPEDLAMVEGQIRRRLTGETKSVQYAFRGVKKTGEVIHVEIYGSFLIFKGKPAAIGTMLDITKKMELEKLVSQSQRMESIGTLAGGIAHDFNNILFPIVGHTEILLEDISEDSPLRESLNEIYTASLRARNLVQQILAFSRQGKSELKLMKMQPIIKEVLKLIRSTIPTTISINQNLQPGCGAVKADPTQIHQILMNLTTNAYHAMEENGGELEVTLKEIKLDEHVLISSDIKPGSYACLTIADTGIGMDNNLIDKIFEPFFTTKENGKGTGMGLSVVHGIVKSMNGEIQVDSEPGKGTEFHIFLPIVKSDFEKQETQTNEPILGGIERILLVDDEKSIIALERQSLTRLGYQVTSFTSSLEALEAFRTNPDKFDLIITDMTMPNLPGDKLAAEFIKIRFDIPILLCTGFSESMSEEKIKSIGIKGLLLKPIIKKDLAKKIREVLEKNEV